MPDLLEVVQVAKEQAKVVVEVDTLVFLLTQFHNRILS